MNILIKLTCLIGLVIAPILGGHTEATGTEGTNTEEMVFIDEDGNKTVLSERQVELIKNDGNATIKGGEDLNNKTETFVEMLKNENNDQVTANVEIRRPINGETTVENRTFTGTEEEVRDQLKDVEGVKIKIKDKE